MPLNSRPPAGSEQALRALVREHGAALLTYAAWFTDDRAAAEDAVQETFVRAWRRLPRLQADHRPLRPWLRRVLRHLLVVGADAARVEPGPLDQRIVTRAARRDVGPAATGHTGDRARRAPGMTRPEWSR